MEQSATVSDFPQRKLAKQLESTAMCRASANAILPAHPQAQLQAKLLALAKPQSPPPPPQSKRQRRLRAAHPLPVAKRQGRLQQWQYTTKDVTVKNQGVSRSIASAFRPTFCVLKIAANAAINGAIGTSHLGTLPALKKRKNQKLFFGGTASDQSIHRITQFQQENRLRAPATSSSLLSAPGSCTISASSMGSSKLIYRSPLADVLQSQDVKELCSLLVIVSAEATKALAEKNGKMDKKGDQLESSLVSSDQEKHSKVEDNVQTSIPDDCLSGDQVDTAGNSGSDGSDAQTGRPPSPSTLALMCDEQDTMVMATGSPDAAASNGSLTNQSSQGQIFTELYAEQERIVLTKFWNFLNRLISCGSIKEAMCSPSPKIKLGIQQEPENCVTTTKTETSHKELDGTSIVKSVDQVVAKMS
ncbi:protein tesmin/TSO1-like CXC 5 isoform X5 [Camellia sinensis]|uniref:protein tesmin/TSO1-like CXC 5 isoform X5 n=1 Tax=Camellia sinensis TaxID=4442 RepID=UPI0010361484|nr:protein tesmin/TSO1-like CXC 5 isoform X5 [Camellia sinensis]